MFKKEIRPRLRKFIKQGINSLPSWMAGGLIRCQNRKIRQNPIRKNIKTFVIQEGFELDVFTKNNPSRGAGPAMSVLVKDRQVVKLDFYGKFSGHYHVYSGKNIDENLAVIKFSNQTRKLQIGEGVELLQNHISGMLERSMDSNISNFCFDAHSFNLEIQKAKHLLLEYAAEFPE